MNTGVIAVVSDSAGVLFIDGERKLDIVPDKIVTMRVSAGQHFADLRGASGATMWQKVVDVPAGAQAAERISLKTPGNSTASIQSAGSTFQLTPCEESHIFRRYANALATCKKEDEALFPRRSGDSTPPHEGSLTLDSKFWLERSRKDFSDHCSQASRGCASLLYALGDYEKALAEASPQIDAATKYFESNQEFHKRTGVYQSISVGIDDKLGAGYVADAYALRGVIKDALTDSNGALADFRTAIEYIGLWKTDGAPSWIDVVNRPFLYKAYLYRAAILYRNSRYNEALTDFNEYIALIKSARSDLRDSEERRLGELIRQAPKSLVEPTQTVKSPEPRPSLPVVDDTDIRSQIDSIARGGRYSPLPDPEMTTLAGDPSRSANALRIIRNDTAYTLHVLMSGPTDRKVDLLPGGSTTLALPPGSYRIGARVDAASVLPFYGVQVLEGGIQYISQFGIK